MRPFFTQLRGRRFWIGPAFFLLAAAPGCWVPVLSTVLRAHGWGELITLAFLVPPVAGTISPLLLGATADQRFPAEKVLAFSAWAGAVFLFTAFQVVDSGGPAGAFLALLTVAATCTAPSWSILTAVALTNLEQGGRNFGLYRSWGTVGWMSAGWIVSALRVDQSPFTGKLGAVTLILAGLVCLMLPHTPPRPPGARTWKDLVGFSAFRILRQRDIAVFLATSFLFSVPLVAFYMQTPQLLVALGHQRVAAAMTLGQTTEFLALLGLGYLLARWRIKWLLLLALGAGMTRFAWYAMGAAQGSLTWVFWGISLHGICWTFFYEAGRVFLDRRVEPGLRAQVQALLTFVTVGIAGILGTVSVGALHRAWVPGNVLAGWAHFWMALALMCGLCALFFALGYQGLASGKSNPAKVPPV